MDKLFGIPLEKKFTPRTRAAFQDRERRKQEPEVLPARSDSSAPPIDLILEEQGVVTSSLTDALASPASSTLNHPQPPLDPPAPAIAASKKSGRPPEPPGNPPKRRTNQSVKKVDMAAVAKSRNSKKQSSMSTSVKNSVALSKSDATSKKKADKSVPVLEKAPLNDEKISENRRFKYFFAFTTIGTVNIYIYSIFDLSELDINSN